MPPYLLRYARVVVGVTGGCYLDVVVVRGSGGDFSVLAQLYQCVI